MSDNDREDQSPCCGDSDCCKPNSTNGGRRKSHWRTIIFTLVLLLASAVAAYSLFLREESTADAGCCPSGTTTAACCPTPATAAPAQKLTWTDFSFVVLLRAEDDLPQHVSDVIATTSDEIGAKAIRPQTVTLRPDDPAFEATVSQYQITKFPSVLVLGTNIAVTLTTDDISRDSIMSLYATNATVSSVPGN